MARGKKGGKSSQSFGWPHAKPFWQITHSSGIQVRASGDGSSAPTLPRCCHLCRDERGLRRITDRCTWNGRHTYDQIINDAFGVIVPPDYLICDHCIAQLHNSQKFRALVYSAFSKVWSECTSFHSADITSATASIQTLQNPSDGVSKISELPHPISEIIKNADDKTTANKNILELLAKKATVNNSKRNKTRKRSISNSVTASKRIIVVCNACGQRYPMITLTENATGHDFICSRCKLKRQKDSKASCCGKFNLSLQGNMKDHLAERSKGDAKKYRQKLSSSTTTQEKPHAYMSDTTTIRPNNTAIFRCSLCPKKYAQPIHLSDHVKRCHADALRCSVCKREFKTKGMLDQHIMQIHSGEALYECDICKRIFKGKNALRLHYLTHENFRISK